MGSIGVLLIALTITTMVCFLSWILLIIGSYVLLSFGVLPRKILRIGVTPSDTGVAVSSFIAPDEGE